MRINYETISRVLMGAAFLCVVFMGTLHGIDAHGKRQAEKFLEQLFDDVARAQVAPQLRIELVFDDLETFNNYRAGESVRG